MRNSAANAEFDVSNLSPVLPRETSVRDLDPRVRFLAARHRNSPEWAAFLVTKHAPCLPTSEKVAMVGVALILAASAAYIVCGWFA